MSLTVEGSAQDVAVVLGAYDLNVLLVPLAILVINILAYCIIAPLVDYLQNRPRKKRRLR